MDKNGGRLRALRILHVKILEEQLMISAGHGPAQETSFDRSKEILKAQMDQKIITNFLCSEAWDRLPPANSMNYFFLSFQQNSVPLLPLILLVLY